MSTGQIAAHPPINTDQPADGIFRQVLSHLVSFWSPYVHLEHAQTADVTALYGRVIAMLECPWLHSNTSCPVELPWL